MSASIKERFKLQTVTAKKQKPFPAIEYVCSGVTKFNAEIKKGQAGKEDYIMASAGFGLEGKEAAAIMDNPMAFSSSLFFREGEILGDKASRDKTFLLTVAYYAGLAELVTDEETGDVIPSFKADVYTDLVESLPETGTELEVTLVFLENVGKLLMACNEKFNVAISHRADKKTDAVYANVTSILPFAELG